MLTLNYEENNINTATLYLNGQRVARHSALLPTIVNISGRFAAERTRVEDFIQAIYAQYYGAEITVDYPLLMSVRNKDNDILAAVGLRYAGNEPLFLEQYTGGPLEQILDCARDDIAEIGNLASAGQGASVFLFSALASYLDYKGVTHAAVTGTDFLHKYFKRAGLRPRKICDADINALEGGSQHWGSYYQQNPRVLVGSVQHGVKALKSLFGAEFQARKPDLFTRIHYKGHAE